MSLAYILTFRGDTEFAIDFYTEEIQGAMETSTSLKNYIADDLK